MPESVVEILGIKVRFPYQPYNLQKLYMKKVIEALNTQQNAVLDSPTGTGKTLCLLCSILSWRENILDIVNNPLKNSNCQFKVPKVLYATRTHQQLDQVVKELRKTSYNINTCVLSSRDNLCINPSVTRVGNGMKRVQACKTAIKRNQCEYFNKTKDNNVLKSCGPISSPSFVFDIEDLLSIGHQYGVCPYYSTKYIDSKQDFYLMPYNYLINNNFYEKDSEFKTVEELVTGNIVVFDEAHNIEKFCEEALSTEISCNDLSKCINEIEYIIGTKFDLSIDYNAVLHLKNVIDMLKTNILLVGEKLPSYNSSNTVTTNSDSLIESCEFFFEHILKPSNINQDNYNLVLNHIDICIGYLLTYGIKGHNNEAFVLHKLNTFIQTVFSCVSFFMKKKPINNVLLNSYNNYQSNFSKINYSKLNSNFYVCFSQTKSFNKVPSDSSVTVQYWCFTASIAMNIFNKAFCVIVTSGTLAPFDMFLKGISLSFPIQLENNHILSDQNLSVNIVSQALDDKSTFLFTYANRSNLELISKLGQSLLLLIERIPEGVLIFFPSYNILETFINHWKKDGIWNILIKTKNIVIESQNKNDFINCVERHHKNLEQVDTSCKNGSILMGVFRGKISEGINFTDRACRAVFVIGIPYPPQNDPKIILKRKCIEKQTNEDKDGHQWYQSQALRAVNQAIGRVIRHKEDFGMIFLVDERFRYDSNRKCLPLWIQKHVNSYKNFESLINEVSIFFRHHGFSKNTSLCGLTPLNFFKSDKIRNSFKNKPLNQTYSENIVSENIKTRSIFSCDVDINKAIKRLREVETDCASDSLRINNSNSLRELLTRKKLPIPNQSLSETTNNVMLESYNSKCLYQHSSISPISRLSTATNYTFTDVQSQKLKLLNLVVDNNKQEKIKNLCLKYFDDKDVSSFIDSLSNILPLTTIHHLEPFIYSEHQSIFKHYIEKIFNQ